MAVSTFSFVLICLVVLASHVSAISLRKAIKIGNEHLRKQCELQQQKLQPLIRALRLLDLERAKKAYTAARPPYEQIEVLSNAFPGLHRNIDARPYQFITGEDDEQWQGFHLIERALWRDLDVSPRILNMTKKLKVEIRKVCDFLRNGAYDSKTVLEGAEALAYDIPALKISSEEEVWSDLSLAVFRNNYQGIWSQVSPFLGSGKVNIAVKQRIRRRYGRVQNVFNKIDPRFNFTTTKGKAKSYSKISVRKRNKIIKIGYRFAQAVSQMKKQILSSASDLAENRVLITEKTSIPETSYRSQVTAGLRYLRSQCRNLERFFNPMSASIVGNDLASAQKHYSKVRAPYEQIEVLAGDFPELNLRIDARPYAYRRGERSGNWMGMHEIERALFRDFNLSMAKIATKRVMPDILRLCSTLDTGIAGGGTFNAHNSFMGMIKLAYEVASRKISSEEETWSDLSLMVFRENLKGIWSQFLPFKAVLDKSVFEAVQWEFTQTKTLFTETFDPKNRFIDGFEFRPYSTLENQERRLLHEAFMKLARKLVAAHKSLVP